MLQLPDDSTLFFYVLHIVVPVLVNFSFTSAMEMQITVLLLTLVHKANLVMLYILSLNNLSLLLMVFVIVLLLPNIKKLLQSLFPLNSQQHHWLLWFGFIKAIDFIDVVNHVLFCLLTSFIYYLKSLYLTFSESAFVERMISVLLSIFFGKAAILNLNLLIHGGFALCFCSSYTVV